MNQTILIHGAPYENEFRDPTKPSPSNTNWFPWLQKQLALRNELCQALEFTRPYDPAYSDWLEIFQQIKLGPDTTVIGHSCGGGFLLRFLSEHPDIQVKQIILVAPWLDPDHELTTDFFAFEIDPTIIDNNKIIIFESSDDEPSVLKSIETIHQKLPNAHYHQYTDKGHFCDKDFPELFAILI